VSRESFVDDDELRAMRDELPVTGDPNRAIRTVRVAVLAACLCLVWAASTRAQEFEPRTYSVTPPGLNFVGLVYDYGGRTTVDGVPRDTIQRNWRLAFMLAYPIRANQGLMLSIGSGGNFGAGTDFDSISLGYQLSWGKP
jgi:hypothetical protein